MARILRALAVALVVVVAGWTAFMPPTAHADPKFPPLTGRVVDDAHILSPATQQELTDKLAGLEEQTHRQLVVVTLPSLQGYEIEDFGYQLGRAWKIGRAGQNDGALFIVAPTEHRVRIEVGYGLEPVLTDAMSSLIIQRAVLPRFKAGDMPGGVVAGTDAIVQQLSLPDDQAKQQVAQASVQRARAVHHHRSSPFSFLPAIFFLFIIFSIIRGSARRGYGRSSGLGGALPWMILGSMMGGGRGGGWSGSGGGWSGGGGGGGFSGGGGSFGGGGSSGSW